MKLSIKILLKFFKTQNLVSKVTLALAIIGVVMGVACLVLAMSVVSGVQTFMQNSVTDLTGHYLILNRSGSLDLNEVESKIKPITPVKAITPFLSSQGVLVHKGNLTGIMLHGLELNTAFDVLNIENKITKGSLSLEPGVRSKAVIGKEISKKFNLNVGDTVNIIVPRMDSVNTSSFNPKRAQFEVSGIVDFGKFDYNDKVILTDISSVQSLTQIGDNYFGLYVNVESANIAKEKTIDVSEALGMDYRVRSWWDLNQNFFTAAELEKIVIFIVILFIVIIASLNISSTIFISVLRKYFDIAILKTLGATESFLIRLFLIQGALIGLVSILVGIFVGVGSALIVKYSNLIDVPGEIYNFDHLPVDIRWMDLVSISVVTFLICLVSSWVPARKGAKQKPTEGLKYESA